MIQSSVFMKLMIDIPIYQQLSLLLMRSLRSKRLNLETSKYLNGPFDESLVQIQLDKNEKCMHEISKNNLDRANQFLKQIKADSEMISPYNRQKSIVKCLSLNTEAYYYQKQNKYDQSLKCLEEAEAIQIRENIGPIEIARTKLNKSVIFSRMGNHQQSVKLAKQALNLLKQKKNLESYELHKNQYKLYEIMIISFYNIASQLSHLSQNGEAQKVYKEGYYLAQKMLGLNHKLTLLLKSILKTYKQQQRSKQKLELSDIMSQKSASKIEQIFPFQLLPINVKERELKRIYASKKKSNTQGKYAKNDIAYYLKSLDKAKKSQVKKKYTLPSTFLDSDINMKEKMVNTGKIRKLYTEASNPNRYEDHQKIKDIILNGKTLNKTHLYSNVNKSETNFVPKQSSLPRIKVQIQPFPDQRHESNIIVPQKKQDDCQLI